MNAKRRVIHHRVVVCRTKIESHFLGIKGCAANNRFQLFVDGVRKMVQSHHTDPLQICDNKRKLHLTLPLRDARAKQGTAVKLQCSVTGFDPVFRWFKNSRPLTWDQNCLNLTKGVIGVVRLAKLTPQDGGEYKCIVSNKFGEVETKCRLEVLPNPDIPLVRPRFAVITDYYVYQFDELVLETRIDSAEDPEVEFFKDGAKINLENGKYSVQIEEDRYRLVISHPTEDDNGIYLVTAKNNAGTDKGNHRIEFRGRDHHKTLDEIKRPTHRKRIRDPADDKHDPNFAMLLQKRNEFRKNSETARLEAEEMRKLTRAERIAKAKEEARHRLTFEATLKDVVMPESSVIKFICSVTGPDPNFKWFRNDEPLTFTKTCKNNSKLNYGCIQISELSLRDAGTYSCEVSNKHCTITSEALLTVLPRAAIGAEPPTFIRSIKEYYNLASDDLILEVRVRGIPSPRVQWIKDCLEVDNPEYFAEGKFICMREPNGVFQLAIHDPSRGDSGRYICQASNVGGKSEVEHYVRVLPKAEYSHVRGIIYADPNAPKAKDHYQQEEDKLERSLEVAKAKKEVLDTMIMNLEKIPEQPVVVKQEVEEEPSEKEEKKPTTPENPKFALTFITCLRNLYIMEGCQARLVCSVDGYSPSYKWLKDGEPLNQTNTVKNLSKDSIGCIAISKVGAADEGTYTCCISNRYCEISTTCSLQVIRKPEIKGLPPRFKRVRHYYDQQTDQLILELQIDGQPFIEMLWYKDCRDVVNDDKYLIGREPDGIYKLYIHKPIRRDCGTYMIQVENQFGMETHKHEIEFWNKMDFVHANRCLHADPKNKRKKMELVPVPSRAVSPHQDTATEVHSTTTEKRYRPFEMPPEISRAEKKKQQYKLEFITTLRNYTVQKGANIKLSCCTSDAIKLKVTWTKDGEPIEKTPNVRENLTKEGICTLEIVKATIEDSGEYECQATTPNGEAACKSKVTVYELEAVTATDIPPVLATAVTGKSQH